MDITKNKMFMIVIFTAVFGIDLNPKITYGATGWGTGKAVWSSPPGKGGWGSTSGNEGESATSVSTTSTTTSRGRWAQQPEQPKLYNKFTPAKIGVMSGGDDRYGTGIKPVNQQELIADGTLLKDLSSSEIDELSSFNLRMSDMPTLQRIYCFLREKTATLKVDKDIIRVFAATPVASEIPACRIRGGIAGVEVSNRPISPGTVIAEGMTIRRTASDIPSREVGVEDLSPKEIDVIKNLNANMSIIRELKLFSDLVEGKPDAVYPVTKDRINLLKGAIRVANNALAVKFEFELEGIKIQNGENVVKGTIVTEDMILEHVR